MNNEVKKTARPRLNLIEAFIVLVILCMVGLRLTVAILVVVLGLLYLLFPVHHSRRALWVTSALLALAALIPFDVYVPGLHGPLIDSKQNGPRLVRVVYGLGARPEENGEASRAVALKASTAQDGCWYTIDTAPNRLGT